MNVITGELTRIFSTPCGSETPSPYWYGGANGHGYLTAVVRHPYGALDEDNLMSAADARACVGISAHFGAGPVDASKCMWDPAQAVGTRFCLF